MQLYIRYFEEETIVSNIDDALTFLSSTDIPKGVIAECKTNLLSYLERNEATKPERFRIDSHRYFIVIKTEATTLGEFQELKAKNLKNELFVSEPKSNLTSELAEGKKGWYDAQILFKRVVCDSDTGKSRYVDTEFQAVLLANSPQNCYDRIIEHLHFREDVDSRSQFPSQKGKNFNCKFLGDVLPEEYSKLVE